jgi:hypothetical protein
VLASLVRDVLASHLHSLYSTRSSALATVLAVTCWLVYETPSRPKGRIRVS